MFDLPRSSHPHLLDACIERFQLDLHGDHGPRHWLRVHHNALLIAEAEEVDPFLPGCFALLHDSCRVDEFHDSGHGSRAAEFAVELRTRGALPPMSEPDFELLQLACRYHSGRISDGPRIARVCWDADRLDLPRVGIEPVPDRMCTAFGRLPSTILAARGRALGDDWVH